MEALRYNKGKIRPSLVPASLTRYVAAGLTYGAEKYTVLDEQGNVISTGVDNWRKGFSYRQLLDSLERHLMEIKEGRDIDEESGLPHLCLLGCNLAFVIEQFDKGFGSDDRPQLAPGRVLEFRLPAHTVVRSVPPAVSAEAVPDTRLGRPAVRGAKAGRTQKGAVLRKGRRKSR